MAGNEWINGYLEAILDAGAKLREQSKISPLSRLPSQVVYYDSAEEAKEKATSYSPTKYFVEEVVSRFDDNDLHKTWVKVVATRNSQERNNRLENLCWRIWHLARKKKQIEREDARMLARRRLEREQGSKEAAEDLSELSEGEKDRTEGLLMINMTKQHQELAAGSSSAGDHASKISRSVATSSDFPRILSDDEVVEDKNKMLYIVLISLHGLVRGENMELGRDSDTGGQVKYVVELARALAATKGVYRVDLLTRQISSPDVDWAYGEPVEMLTRPSDLDATGDSCGAYIIRLPCGPRESYIPKEYLWPHIPEFVDRALGHITNVAWALADQTADRGSTGPVWPYVIHGHYADAAEVAAHLASALNVPMVMTGHSLGRNKLEQLLKQGRLTRDDINTTYRIMRRIEGEETGLDTAEVVVTSTKQEIEEQWGLYDGFDLRLERKLRVRKRRGVSCLGRYMPRMLVIPPGMDFSYVDTKDLMEGDSDLQMLINPGRAQNARDLPPIWSEVMRFFTNPHKPMILALSRPDPKKNVVTLLKAYGESRHLRELANLTLILGNRDDIEEMPGGSGTVLTQVLKLIDRYDLYGQVAYPKHHKQSDVPNIYRLAAKTKGVFINPALVEPFGLTIIEAAAYGLPVVATRNGGPVDILKVLNNGILVDPHDAGAITTALLRLLADKTLWLDCRRNGLRNIQRFSWPHHCRLYLGYVAQHCSHATTGPGDPSRVNLPDDEPLTESIRDLSISVDTAESKLHGSSNDVAASILDVVRRRRPEMGTKSTDNVNYTPGRRHHLVVIAIDCYNEDGQITLDILDAAIKNIMTTNGSNGPIGYVISTGSTLAELKQALGNIQVEERAFDALICSSGAEVYFPWREAAADMDYSSQIGFRWPAENVKSAIPKLAAADGGDEDDLVVDESACSNRSYAYAVKSGSKVRKTDVIRQRLRMRGFRCNVVYTRAGTRLNVLPLFASRSRALRYLSIKWGIELSKVAVFVGENGDTDHERLLPGLHKALILPGLVSHACDALVRENNNFRKEDVVPKDAQNVIVLSGDDRCYDLSNVF